MEGRRYRCSSVVLTNLLAKFSDTCYSFQERGGEETYLSIGAVKADTTSRAPFAIFPDHLHIPGFNATGASTASSAALFAIC